MSCHVLPCLAIPAPIPFSTKFAKWREGIFHSRRMVMLLQLFQDLSGSQVLTSQMAHKKCPPNGITDGTSLALTSLIDPRPEKADDIEELPMEEMRDTELCIDLELRIDLVDLMAEPGTDMDRWSGFWGMGVPKNHGEDCGIIR